MDGRKLWEDPLQHPVCTGLMVRKKLENKKLQRSKDQQ